MSTSTPFAFPRRLATVLLASTAAVMIAVPATPAFAGGDIVKCVAADGTVTLTDGQCSGVSKVIVLASMNTAPDVAPATGVVSAASPAVLPVGEAPARPLRAGLQKTGLTVEPVQHDNWIDPRPRAKMFDRDAATLRAARTSLQALDEASAAARQQRLASN